MQVSFSHQITTIFQPVAAFGKRVIDSALQNKVAVAALFALGCLAAYLFARRRNNSPPLIVKASPGDQTPQPPSKIETAIDKAKVPTDAAKDPVVNEDQEKKEDILQTSSSPLPSPKENRDAILDDKKEEEASLVLDPTPDPEDPAEIQKRLDQQAKRRDLIIDAVKNAQRIQDIEQYLESEDDLILILQTAVKCRSEKVLKSSEEYGKRCFSTGEEGLLIPLFWIFDYLSWNPKERFKDPVGIAVHHVKGHVKRLYLAGLLDASRDSVVHSKLTLKEILEFVKDIEQPHWDTYKDEHGYAALVLMAGRYINQTVFDSISQYYAVTDPQTLRDPETLRSDERNKKRIGLFNEFYAGFEQESSEKYISKAYHDALRYHDPELLQAALDAGHEEEYDDEFEWVRKTIKLMQEKPYGDYYRLKDTIDVLIKNEFLSLDDLDNMFSAKSVDDLILRRNDLLLKRFEPYIYVLFNMLESSQRDLPTLMEVAKRLNDSSAFSVAFKHIMERAGKGIEGSVQACQFLHDHYDELEDTVKKDLAAELNKPENQSVKQKYFNDLGI